MNDRTHLAPPPTDTARHEHLADLGLDASARARLRRLGQRLRPHLPEALDRFRHLFIDFSKEHWRKAEVRQTFDFSAIDGDYLERLFAAEFDDAYCASRARIGKAHSAAESTLSAYRSAVAGLRSFLVPLVLDTAPPAQAPSEIDVLERAFDLDLSLVLDAYAESQRRRLESLVDERTRELALSEEHRHGIFEHTTDAILTVDREQRLVGWNRAAQNTFGYAREEILGRPWSVLWRDPDRAASEVDFMARKLDREGSLHNYEIEMRSASGRVVTVICSSARLRDDNGAPAGASMILRNITSTHEFERQIAQAERLAALGILAGEFAHEIGTPLNIIAGRTEILLQSFAEGDPRRSAAETVMRQTGRITDLMKRTLGALRIEQVSDVADCDVEEAVREVLEFLSGQLGRRKIVARLDLLGNLPRAKIFRGSLQQILFNLIHNAVDAMPHGGDLTVTANQARCDALRLEIRDTGIGMEDEVMDHIFEPLYTTKAPGKGTGLGLTIAKRLTEAAGGTILAESASGSGSTFTLELPIER